MKPNVIVERLEEVIGIEGSPQRVIDIIEREMKVFFGLPPIIAAEEATRFGVKVIRIIEERYTAANETGIAPILSLTGAMNDIVCGACFPLAGDSAAISQLKRQRARHSELLLHIRSLSFAQFELFGSKILQELGAKEAYVTQHSDDQGIDFYGRLSLGELQSLPPPFFRLSHDLQLLFAGQAKHYPTNAVGPNVVRELIGAVALARTKTFSNDGVDIFKDLNIRPFSPVVTLLFTTGRFSSGALHLAAAAGIILKDGAQLAAFLADKGAGFVGDEDNRRFDPTCFQHWLHS